MKSSRVLIKLGGAALQDETVLHTVTEALVEYRRYGYQVILVHGGGPAINSELVRRGITWNFLNGQRVTSPEIMDVVEHVLCGDINRKLVRHLGSKNLPAVGFSGVDGKTLLCKQACEELGQVGAIEEVAAKWIDGLLALPGSPIPVIAPIGVGLGGEAYNINADWAASHLAVALNAEYLIFLTDQIGILDENKKLIPQIEKASLEELVEQDVVKGGMLTKTKTILHALDHGLKGVRVMAGRDAVRGLWSDYVGTWCLPYDLPAYAKAHLRDEDSHYAAV